MAKPIKILASGYPGSGKSYLGLSFPKIAWIITEYGTDVLLDTHPNLAKNVVWHENRLYDPQEDPREVIKAIDGDIAKAKVDYKAGLIETLAFDNFTFYANLEWERINRYEMLRATNGAVDTRGMYGILRRYLYNRLCTILAFPGNVYLTCHEQMEGEEAMAGKTDKSTPVVPNVLGSVREVIGGMFGASLFLVKKRVGDNKYIYSARCQKGNLREAKNRMNLPEVVENVTYSKIIESIGKGV